MTTLFGVSILVTTYPEYSKQTLLCNKHNVSNLILVTTVYEKLHILDGSADGRLNRREKAAF